jgi:hypothetical protein
VAEECEVPHLDHPRVPLRTDFRYVLQLRHELAQYLRVRGPIEQEQTLIIEDPRPAPLASLSSPGATPSLTRSCCAGESAAPGDADRAAIGPYRRRDASGERDTPADSSLTAGA